MPKSLTYSDEWEAGDFRNGFKLVIRKPYLHIISSCSDTSVLYDYLVEKQGRSIKNEKRTHIRLWETLKEDFFFKHYLYPGLPRIRTIGIMPKAKREYLTFSYLEHQNIPCIKAAGWGVRWDRVGGVKSCFIITAKAKDTIDLRFWLVKTSAEAHFEESVALILKKLGCYFRHLHSNKFFLLRANTRNILIHELDLCNPRILFLDQPYARFLSGPLANWGQLKELSTVLGGFFHHIDQSAIDLFFKTYLPDPLGKYSEDLRQRLIYLIRTRDKRGWFSKFTSYSTALVPYLFDKKQ
jgi:hypothetical protein